MNNFARALEVNEFDEENEIEFVFIFNENQLINLLTWIVLLATSS